MEPGRVFYLDRKDLDRAEINIPFQPDWLAEVLGATEIDPAIYRLDRDERDAYSIITQSRTPAGLVDKRLTFTRTDNRLTSIQLFNSTTGAQLAAAIVDEYWDDPKTGLYCPRKVRLIWPEAGSKMTVSLRRNAIELNGIPREQADIMFSRDGLSDKEPVNVANMNPPAGGPVGVQPAAAPPIRANSGYGPRPHAVLTGGVELGTPKAIGR
jgi:hypothetical protein